MGTQTNSAMTVCGICAFICNFHTRLSHNLSIHILVFHLHIVVTLGHLYISIIIFRHVPLAALSPFLLVVVVVVAVVVCHPDILSFLSLVICCILDKTNIRHAFILMYLCQKSKLLFRSLYRRSRMPGGSVGSPSAVAMYPVLPYNFAHSTGNERTHEMASRHFLWH